MELSMRMKQVADMVPRCTTVADIGCDHGYVSIYLLQQQVAKRCIAMDLRPGPLSRAQENCSMQGLSKVMECRLSDGMEKLKPGEADVAVIAGMGGPLIAGILERAREQGVLPDTLVLQPQSSIPEVRHAVHNMGFCIQEEEMLLEDGKYYWMFRIVPGEEHYEHEVEYLYGAPLLRKKSACLYDYLCHEADVQKSIWQRLQDTSTEKSLQRLNTLKQEIQWNQEAMQYYEVKGID